MSKLLSETLETRSVCVEKSTSIHAGIQTRPGWKLSCILQETDLRLASVSFNGRMQSLLALVCRQASVNHRQALCTLLKCRALCIPLLL